MWLKGYLDALNSALGPASGGGDPQPWRPFPPRPVSRSPSSGDPKPGTRRRLARNSQNTRAKGHSPTLRDMAEVSSADLPDFDHLLVITSTYGEGEPPDNAAPLHSALHAPTHLPRIGQFLRTRTR